MFMCVPGETGNGYSRSFRSYLLRYQSGEIDDVSREMRVEVKRALWIPLEEAPRKLAYRGERDVVRRAQQYLQSHPEV